MPTYDLTCAVCGHRAEKFVLRIIRDEDCVCPECGAEGMRVGVGGGFLGAGARSAGGTGAAASPAGCGNGGFG